MIRIFYRLDLTLSRLEKFLNGKTRNAWYYLEAPFNENGRYLVLQAQLRNSSTGFPGPISGGLLMSWNSIVILETTIVRQ